MVNLMVSEISTELISFSLITVRDIHVYFNVKFPDKFLFLSSNPTTMMYAEPTIW